jgi:hypothetical protein
VETALAAALKVQRKLAEARAFLDADESARAKRVLDPVQVTSEMLLHDR